MIKSTVEELPTLAANKIKAVVSIASLASPAKMMRRRSNNDGNVLIVGNDWQYDYMTLWLFVIMRYDYRADHLRFLCSCWISDAKAAFSILYRRMIWESLRSNSSRFDSWSSRSFSTFFRSFLRVSSELNKNYFRFARWRPSRMPHLCPSSCRRNGRRGASEWRGPLR